jgi:hypothetical protein
MQRHFYAMGKDLLTVCGTVESKRSLRYTEMGLLKVPPTTFVKSETDLSIAASTAHGLPGSSGFRYLVTIEGSTVHVREVPQNSGGTRYAVDQLVNPDSMELATSALHPSNILVYGRVATASDSALSKNLYAAFSRAIERHFRRVDTAWVGPEAEAAWRHGTRLAIGAFSPAEYDLCEPHGNTI